MMLRQLPQRIGMKVVVRHAVSAYRLPEGLPDGAECVLVGMDTGIREVEFQGRRFSVPMACVDSGWERINSISSRTS